MSEQYTNCINHGLHITYMQSKQIWKGIVGRNQEGIGMGNKKYAHVYSKFSKQISLSKIIKVAFY